MLKNKDYVEVVKGIIEREKENEMYKEDKRIWWENVKFLIKKYSIKYSILKNKCKKTNSKRIKRKTWKRIK